NPKSLNPAGDKAYAWTFDYDPDGAEGLGEIVYTFDGRTYRAAVAPGHKADGAVCGRFGIMNVQITGDEITYYVGESTINGEVQDLSADPGWAGLNNRTSYTDCVLRPFHDFTWRDTQRAGGAPGEIGGFVWRIDPKEPEGGLVYGAPATGVSWDHPFEASGG